MLMDMCGYDIWRQGGSPWVKSWYEFGVAAEEGFKVVWGDVVRGSVDMSGGWRSLGVIGS